MSTTYTVSIDKDGCRSLILRMMAENPEGLPKLLRDNTALQEIAAELCGEVLSAIPDHARPSEDSTYYYY